MRRIILAVVVLSGGLSFAEKCVTSCLGVEDGVVVCYYEEKAVCSKRQVICVESYALDCRPLSVNLGTWAPRPVLSEDTTITYTTNSMPYSN